MDVLSLAWFGKLYILWEILNLLDYISRFFWLSHFR